MKHALARAASGLLNLISGGVVGDVLVRQRTRSGRHLDLRAPGKRKTRGTPVTRAPERVSPVSEEPAEEVRDPRVRLRGDLPPRARGVPPSGATAAQEELRRQIYRSLSQYSRMQLGLVLREMLTGLMGSIVVAGCLFPALYGLCHFVCRRFGDARWAEPTALAIALGWFALIFLLSRTLDNHRIELDRERAGVFSGLLSRLFFRQTPSHGHEETARLRLGRLGSLGDPRSAQTISFFILTTIGTHAALLYLTPDFFFARPVDLSAGQPVLAAIDNVFSGSLANEAGVDTGFPRAEALLSPYGRVLFVAYRSLCWALLGAFLLWGQYRILWMWRLYRKFHRDPSRLGEWVRRLSDNYLVSFANETIFLVLASKYVDGDTQGAKQVIRDFKGIVVSDGVRDLLPGGQTDRNLFEEVEAESQAGKNPDNRPFNS